LRNAKALLVFGLAWTVVIFGVSLLIGLVAVVTGNPQIAATALMPLGLLVTAMFSTSLYFTFRDSFVAPTEPESPTPGELP
jgi:hypothetical protein